jgi:glyoxylase-like metal-dependent hydrolase (beta-lactamase superfamily II)
MSPQDGGGSGLSFPHAAPPPPGSVIDVAPGVRWLRMPLPFALDHINLWLVEDGAGWAIVDTGLASDATKELWEHIIATQLGGRPVTRVIVTHFHPDHMGLAGWLTERLGVELWATETEWLQARLASLDDRPALETDAEAFYGRIGLEGDARAMLRGRRAQYAKRVSPIPVRFRRLSDGMTFLLGGRSWRVVVGRGHAPEHASLHCAELDLFIAGDQVLPKITPNITVWPHEPEGDPLGRYLASLGEIAAAVPGSVLALPSHGLPFRGLHQRIHQIAAHHDARLLALEAACAAPRTAAEIVPVLFRRKLDAHQLAFAVGETLSHLNSGLAEGRLRRSERGDGVWLYARA